VKDGNGREAEGKTFSNSRLVRTWTKATPAKQFVARRALGVSATPLAMAHVPRRKASVEIA